MRLKSILLLFLLCAGILFSESTPSCQHKGNPQSSASVFWLSPTALADLKKAAFEGDLKSARRVSEFYCFSNYQPDVFFVWLYIEGLLSDDENAWIGLNSHLEGGQLKSTDVFLPWEARIGELEGKDDTFSRFVLYRYYLSSGDSQKAQTHRALLEKAGVTARLLREVKFNDYPNDVSRDFHMRYRIVNEKELAHVIDSSPDALVENIKNPFFPFGGLYLLGFFEQKQKSEILVEGKEPAYMGFPIELIFYKTDNPYYRKKVKYSSVYYLGYFLIPLGYGAPEQYATLKYAILPLPPQP